MLRYWADLRTIAFLCIYFGLVAFQWVAAPAALWLAIPLVILTCWFSFFGAVATHNTVHCPVWRSRAANRVFQVVLTLSYGHMVSAYVPGHNLSHHKHTQKAKDVMRTTKVRFRWNLLNGLLFMPTVGPSIVKGEAAYFKAMKVRHPAWYRQMLLERVILWAAYLSLFALDVSQTGRPWRFLLYVILPHQYAAWGIITMNLLQHDGCDEDSEFNHSRNFVGDLVNFFTFNNGYHGTHHDMPGLHWSLTPAAHREKYTGKIHPALEQRSLLGYLFRTFVWPGQRVTYDGRPLTLPPATPDQEWVPTPKETPEDLGAVAGA